MDDKTTGTTTPQPHYPPLPTLEECLQMEEDAELMRLARSRQKWAEFMREIDELRAEVSQR